MYKKFHLANKSNIAKVKRYKNIDIKKKTVRCIYK